MSDPRRSKPNPYPDDPVWQVPHSASDKPLRTVHRVDLATRGARARYYRSRAERQERERIHPRACRSCGRDSCGNLWHESGQHDGTQCCEQCTHEPMPNWEQTHVLHIGRFEHPVMAVSMREGDVVFFRRDGVVEFIEQASPDGRCRVAWLGRDVSNFAKQPVCLPDSDEFDDSALKAPLSPWGERTWDVDEVRYLGRHPYDVDDEPG